MPNLKFLPHFLASLPLILLTACSQNDSSSTSTTPPSSLPDLNRPKVLSSNSSTTTSDTSSSELNQTIDGINVRHHPWIARQNKVTGYCPPMLDDIEMTLHFHDAMENQRKQSGQPSKEFGDDLTMIITQIDYMQSKIPFSTPENLYSVLNLPDLSAYSRNIPFTPRLVKRLYLGESELGFPLYLDVRRADGASKEEVIAWHLNLLETGPAAFHKVKSGEKKDKMDEEIYLGRGDYKAESDPTHGLAREDRAIYLHFKEVANGGESRQGKELYYLYFDGPHAEFEQHQDQIVGIR